MRILKAGANTKLRVYEQKLASISTYKVSEEHFATGRNGQIYVFKRYMKVLRWNQ